VQGIRDRLTSIRGRLVIWYLGILVALLTGLCIVQTMTLTSYLRSTTAGSMAQAAQSELATIGPCFVRTSTDLYRHAQQLAALLGSDNVAAKIVTPTGQALADGGLGMPVAAHPLQLSGALVHQITRSAAPVPWSRSVSARSAPCNAPVSPSHPALPHDTPSPSSVRQGGLLFIGIALGPRSHPVGYAILARSMATEDATLLRARLTLIFGAIAVVIIAAIVALPIINRSLRPLRRVTSTAEAIAAGDLEQRASLSPSIDEIGRLGKAFDTMVDRLQTALATATASEERMRQFLADASHELRTPLTVLRGTSQILMRHKNLEPEEGDAALSAIHDEAIRLSRLVDDLLTLSKLDAGQPLDPRPVVISRFLEEFVERYASAWPARTIGVDRRELDGAEANVDPEALRRMLTNVIDNAARYSTAGKPITIEGGLDAGTVSILVRDEGPGLSPEDAERLFERFYRGNKSRSRLTGGTGLGLAIVHALVQQSRGEIHLDTGPDRGTTVAITLPRLKEPSQIGAR